MAIHDEKLVEKRCSGCNSLLAKLTLRSGKIEIKCRCGTINTIEADIKIKSESQISIMEVTVQRSSRT